MIQEEKLNGVEADQSLLYTFKKIILVIHLGLITRVEKNYLKLNRNDNTKRKNSINLKKIVRPFVMNGFHAPLK